MSEQGGTGGVKPGSNSKGAKAAGRKEQAGDQDALQGRPGEPPEQGGSQPQQPLAAASDGGRASWGRYLVAPRPLGLLPGRVPPLEAPALFALLEEDPEVEPVAQVRPARAKGPDAGGPHPACPPVAVVAMPTERARALAANPQVIVEADQPLAYTPLPQAAAAACGMDPALTVPLAEPAPC
ncbi:hypothetical protein ACWDA7_45895 [Streptomyces sp. NPDC001156]